eukprot:1968258-Prymnesium_polylepis.1
MRASRGGLPEMGTLGRPRSLPRPGSANRSDQLVACTCVIDVCSPHPRYVLRMRIAIAASCAGALGRDAGPAHAS